MGGRWGTIMSVPPVTLRLVSSRDGPLQAAGALVSAACVVGSNGSRPVIGGLQRDELPEVVQHVAAGTNQEHRARAFDGRDERPELSGCFLFREGNEYSHHDEHSNSLYGVAAEHGRSPGEATRRECRQRDTDGSVETLS